MKLIIRFHLLFVLLYMLLTSGKHQVAHSSLTGSHHALSIQCNVHFFTVRQEQVSSASLFFTISKTTDILGPPITFTANVSLTF